MTADPDTNAKPDSPAKLPKIRRRMPEVFDRAGLDQRGVSIPAPTPTGVNVPNPWGSASRPPAPDAPNGADPPAGSASADAPA